jgi:probable F420-dependent oxidoreductase
LGTIGISVYDMGATDVVHLAQAADSLGFHAIWLGEHLLRPVDYASEHPSVAAGARLEKPVIEKGTKLIDPLVTLAAASAVTSQIRLATGIYLLPLRHPLATARMVASVYDVSDGRVLLGTGVGWLREEFAALGVPYGERGGRYAECIEILREAWSGREFSYDGRYYCFDMVQVCATRVDIPLVLGGNGPKALQRAARLGDAWFASGTPPFERACDLFRDITCMRDAFTTQPPLQCFFRISGSGPRDIERYGRAGLHNVVVWADQVWKGASLWQKQDSLAAAAKSLGL